MLDVKALLNKLISTRPIIDAGTREHRDFNPVTVAGASSSYITINFSQPFTSAPQVIVQENNQSLNNYGSVNISVSNVTTTGFNMYIHSVPNATLAGLYYDWVAIEVK